MAWSETSSHPNTVLYWLALVDSDSLILSNCVLTYTVSQKVPTFKLSVTL